MTYAYARRQVGVLFYELRVERASSAMSGDSLDSGADVNCLLARDNNIICLESLDEWRSTTTAYI